MRNSNRACLALTIAVAIGALTLASDEARASDFETLTFPSGDGLEVTADLYLASEKTTTPLIVLCHQAGWSRGEYREIAPKLVKLGFNCLAIDQRSGKAINEVPNVTVRRASEKGLGTAFVDAEQDLLAAIKFAKQDFAKGKLLLWGSSYSSALALRIAGEHPDELDGVLAFAPGEYFTRFDKPGDWIEQSAAKITVPAFITSAREEFPRWKSIYEAIPGNSKQRFVPTTAGNHGSRALWSKFSDSADYWQAVEAFLKQYR